MGNFGFWEIMIVLVVVLLLFGAKKLPELAKSMGKSIGEFKKGVSEGKKDSQNEAAKTVETKPEDEKKV